MKVSYLNAEGFLSVKSRGDTMAIVDLRTPAEVAAECLGGCIPLPLQELSSAELDRALQATSVGKDAPIYLLCQTGKRAEAAVKKLVGKEDVILVILEGGLNAIKAAGGDIQKNKQGVICLERQVRIATGSLVVCGVALGFLVDSGFFFLSGLVGTGLVFAGITNTCGMGMLLARMPWNTK